MILTIVLRVDIVGLGHFSDTHSAKSFGRLIGQLVLGYPNV